MVTIMDLFIKETRTTITANVVGVILNLSSVISF